MVFKKKINSTFSELRDLENDFENFLKVNRIPSDVIYDLKMALHEYMLNVMEHGYHWVPDKEIDFEVVISEKDNSFDISMTITDSAPKFEISKDRVTKAVGNRGFRGRGLLMILTFVDDIVYDHSFEGGNKVTLKKFFSRG